MVDSDLNKEKCIIPAISGKQEPWSIQVSTAGKNCKNYIREIVDTLDLQPNPEKQVIALSIGDPTLYGNLKPPQEAIDAVLESLKDGTHNGYAPSVGYSASRAAVAAYATQLSGYNYGHNDVILTSGCSAALEICITALADASKSQHILVPRPGFSIYTTIAQSIGVAVKYYNLQPNAGWQIDLAHLAAQIDAKTACIVLNNPSNPCGSVYSAHHLREVLHVARKHRVPVIADEIYEEIVFPGEKFVSAAALDAHVPVLVCGGLSKRFLVPGWRMGWILVHDAVGAFAEVRTALVSLSQRTIGSNTVIQGALPAIFELTKQEFYDGLIRVLVDNASLVYRELVNVKGLKPYMPQGAMYMMVEIEMRRFPFGDTLEFVTKLMEEESVFCLPGDCFQLPGYLRVVITAPEELLEDACDRIKSFCERHYIKHEI